MEVVLLIGIPGSGKTTFYRQRLAATHAHVSKDNFRNNRDPKRRQAQLLTAALEAGKDVVVDNTHVTPAARQEAISIAKQFHAKVIGYVFDVEPHEALRRNRLREGKARVPDVAIYTMAARYEPPRKGEGFDELHRIVARERQFDVQD